MSASQNNNFDTFSFSMDSNAPVLEAELAVGLTKAPAPGESPRFDSRGEGRMVMIGVDEPVLYDIPEGKLCTGEKIEPVKLPRRSGMCALTSNPAKLILAQEADLCFFDLKEKRIEPLLEAVEPSEKKLRLNDGDVLSFKNTEHPLHGCLVVGGISETKPRQPDSSLYAIEPGTLKKHKLLGNIVNSNGLGTIGDYLVHTDTEKRAISFYSFTGFDAERPLAKVREISFKELTAADALEGDSYPKPDGLVITANEDVLLVALFRAGKVVALNPEGEHLFSVAVAAPLTASCELVGSELFVTTAKSESYPDSGNVFVADLAKMEPSISGKARGIFQL